MMEIPDRMASYELVTRHIVMAKDLNAFGNLFGGVMMAWLDEAAALYVMEKIGYGNFVTVSMDDVVFKTPAHLGAAVLIFCRTTRLGRSSVEIQTRAFVRHPVSGLSDEVITCKITFVCLKEGKPFGYFQSPEFQAWLQKPNPVFPTSPEFPKPEEGS